MFKIKIIVDIQLLHIFGCRENQGVEGLHTSMSSINFTLSTRAGSPVTQYEIAIW